MSTLLYHGPTAREAAVTKAEEIGRLLAPPFGDDGLKVETAREIADKLSTTPIGDRIGTVVIGPFDDVTPEAADGLLKTLEDFDHRYLLPVLWARDSGSVSGTVRSRCLEIWCPPSAGYSPEAPFLTIAKDLCEAALRRRTAAVIEAVAENKGHEVEVLRASCEVLAKTSEWPMGPRLLLWDNIRSVLKGSRGNPSALATLTAYLV